MTEQISDLNVYMRKKYICICRSVGEDEIRDAVRSGARTFKEVQDITECATSCGTCQNAIERELESILKEMNLKK